MYVVRVVVLGSDFRGSGTLGAYHGSAACFRRSGRGGRGWTFPGRGVDCSSTFPGRGPIVLVRFRAGFSRVAVCFRDGGAGGSTFSGCVLSCAMRDLRSYGRAWSRL